MCVLWDWCGSRARILFHRLKLPRQGIVLAVRQDSSGTTCAFTDHLSAVIQEWRDPGPGVGRLLQWPVTAMAVRIQAGERHER
jgi:phosphate transport system substrate-binding protein